MTKTSEMMMDDEGGDFDAEMEKLAVHLTQEAQKSGVKLEEKVKAFQALQPYHAAREKYKGKQAGSNKTDGHTFRDFKSGVRGTPTQEQ